MWDIFVGLFTGIVLLIIEKFLMPKDGEKNEKINGNTIVPESVIKSEKVIIKEKVVYVNQKKKDDHTDWFMLLILFLGIVSVVGYIKYSKIIHSTIIITSTAIGIMALGMAFFCIKKGMKFEKELNLLLIINTLALVIVPWLINLTTKASEKQGIDITILKQKVELGNLFGSVDIYDILFLMYQILGLVSGIIYMFYILISNLYIVSLININLDSKWSRMWLGLYKKTYRFVKKPITVVIREGVSLAISYLLVSGVFWNLIEQFLCCKDNICMTFL